MDETEVLMEIQHRASTKRDTMRASVRTIEHGTVLIQRDVQSVVHMVRVGNDVFLVRDLPQTLGLSGTSDRRR
jgi:hypothetical protein